MNSLHRPQCWGVRNELSLCFLTESLKSTHVITMEAQDFVSTKLKISHTPSLNAKSTSQTVKQNLTSWYWSSYVTQGKNGKKNIFQNVELLHWPFNCVFGIPVEERWH